MEAIQTLTHIILNITTDTIFPQVFVKLKDEQSVLTRINSETYIHTLQGSVKWPGNITITNYGNVILQLRKEIDKNWKIPLVNTFSLVFPESNFWDATVISNEFYKPNICDLRLKFNEKIYIFWGVGRGIHVKNKKIDGKKGQKKCVPLPEIPKENLNETIPGINTNRSTEEIVHLMVKIKDDEDSHAKWICSRTKEDYVQLSAPSGLFHPSFFKNAKKVFAIADSAGLLNILSTIVYLLQDNRLPVLLLYNCIEKSDILLKDMLDKLMVLTTNFDAKIYLLKPHQDWKGGKGRVNEASLLANGVPAAIPNVKRGNTANYFVISGSVPYSLRILKLLLNKRKFNVPRKNIARIAI
ncbi:uncharacterized protein LOC142318079 [Lycorma delicatula]|uniref:uncharacterized protein LOC142318079 n=1 Tax=Lycorma delicatula TaxID=130591 RepID=UPI003F515EE1